MEWDGSHKAPDGMIRVIGEDLFLIPPAEFWIGDFQDEETAVAKALKDSGEFLMTYLYSDQGRCIAYVTCDGKMVPEAGPNRPSVFGL